MKVHIITVLSILFHFPLLTVLHAKTEISKIKPKINHVTVYADRANIKRSATVQLKKGEHNLLIENLPPELIPESIQVQTHGGVILKNIHSTKRYLKTSSNVSVKDLEAKRKIAQENINKQNIKLQLVNKEKDFLDKIVVKLTGKTEKSQDSEFDPSKWSAMIDFYNKKYKELEEQQYVINTEIQKEKESLNIIKHSMSSLGKPSKKLIYVTTIELIVPEDLEAEINLSYITKGARWVPNYDLRVSSDTDEMYLTYQALIYQNSSEKWENAKISLSTARPNIDGTQPELKPWLLSMTDHRYRAGRRSLSLGLKAESYAAKSSKKVVGVRAMELQKQIKEEFKTKVQDQIASYLFDIAGIHTIKNNNMSNKVIISQQTIAADLTYSTTPKLLAKAYLKAKCKNTSEFPFLAGKTNIFLNNNFVGKSKLDFIAPEEEFTTDLGIDESIRIKHKRVKKMHSDRGIFNKSNVIEHEFAIEMKNLKNRNVKIIVWDQIPTSSHEDLKIRLIEPVIKKDDKSITKTEEDFIKWDLTLKAGEEVKLPLKYSVTYPNDMQLYGLNR